MDPCSNPELVAAASNAGALGIVPPISLTWVHGWDFREGLRHIRRKSVEGIDAVEPVGTLVARFEAALETETPS